MDIVLGGRIVHADEALSLGIVDYVVPSKEVFEFSLKLLEKINGDKPLSIVNSVMQSLNNARKLPFDRATEEETKLFSRLVIGQLEKEQASAQK
jgi:enoyl-CoA hydratase/carnithine racemase